MADIDPHTEPKEFVYKQDNYSKWVKDFGNVLGAQVKNDSIVFAPEVGNGYIKSYTIENGFTACVSNYYLNYDIHINRQPTDQFGVIIYLYHFETTGMIEYKINAVELNLEDGHHHTLRVINSQTMQQVNFVKHTAIQGISIFLESEWIRKNINFQLKDVFHYLKEVNFFKEFINAKQHRLMNEIITLPLNHSYHSTFIKSRIYRIVDKLLASFLQRDISESPERMSEEDFKTLQHIETILTESQDETFPGIDKLSRKSLMSESKLKKLFKQSFGMGLYEYYQKNRMHRAKEYILSGKYSISEVGSKLGYQNLSNFSVAFRKEFQCLPSEITIQRSTI